MRNRSRIWLILIIFAITNVSTLIFNVYLSENDGTTEARNKNNLKSPRSSGYWTTNFIHVDRNWSATVIAYDWCSGDGSWGNPYTIENVTIDASTSPTGSGIYIHNSINEYFLIRNCMVSNAGNNLNDAGIRLENTTDGALIDNIVLNSRRYGIFLHDNCQNNTISGNIANTNSVHGIFLWIDCVNNNISGNTVNGNKYYGIRFDINCDNNSILGNNATNNDDGGIWLRIGCDNNTILRNTADNNGAGIRLDTNCNNNTISGNTANNNEWAGIFLGTNCSDNTISGNTANGASQTPVAEFAAGITLYYCDNNLISGNTISDNEHGIVLVDYCDYNTILGNSAENNWWGIRLQNYCKNNSISNNTANNNDVDGIWLFNEVNNNTISGNIANNNARHGIYFYMNCDKNFILGNTANDNIQHGIFLEMDSNDNTISGNIANNNARHGIRLYENCDKNFILGNTIKKNARTGINLVRYCDNNTIWGNTAHDNIQHGIFLEMDSNDNIIWGNTVNDNDQYGIYIMDSNNNFINQNNLTNNKINCLQEQGISYNFFSLNICNGINQSVSIDANGRYGHTWSEIVTLLPQCSGSGTWNDPYILKDLVFNCHNVGCGILIQNSKNIYFRIEDCTIYNSSMNQGYAGIKLENSNNGFLINNNCSNNQRYGIFLKAHCDNNTISGNNINYNVQYGIILDFLCNNNLIYLNNINGNGINARDDGNNQWDNGTIGNYWGDYGGIDLDDNGIGDTPYDVPPPGGNVDNFPIWDDNPHVILINSPSPGDIFGPTAPTFNVFINFPIFDTSWYTLDYGLTNYIFIGTSGTINPAAWYACEEGPISIKFFVNNTAGDFLYAEITIFKDILVPTIEINLPTNNLTFEDLAPVYDISIEEGNLVKTWYTMDGGITNITFTELTGVINQTLWNTLPNGHVTIRFYARDIAGNIGYSDVIVIKNVPYYLLYVEMVDQSFSKDGFNITCFISDENCQGIDSATVKMWWNGNDISNEIINLGNGLYFISLEPITVAPGENPILLSMIISADGYIDKSFEMYIAVDPDTLNKDGVKHEEEFPLIITIIAITSILAGIGVVGVSIFLLRRRHRVNKTIQV
ncbi:MAG: NosD domain-containing protein [Promethearchaeota archaeon]